MFSGITVRLAHRHREAFACTLVVLCDALRMASTRIATKSEPRLLKPWTKSQEGWRKETIIDMNSRECCNKFRGDRENIWAAAA